MDAQTFLDNFGTIADAPGGIDRLRGLMLALAVQGQLSERHASDGPPPFAGLEPAQDRPIEIPAEWNWVVLDGLGPHGERTTADGPFGSKLKTSHYVDEPGHRVIRLGNIGLGYFKNTDQSFVAAEHFEALSGYHLRSGDVLVASLGNPCGRACSVPDSVLPALNKADCFRVRLDPSINHRFITLVLNSPMILARASGLNRGDTRGRINLSHLKATPIPLPARAEQDRIVAKVDELMQLCDQLEARQHACQHISNRLRASSLDALSTAETSDGLLTAWSRIHANWDALTDYSDSTEALRQAVLEVAVCGHLNGSTIDPESGIPVGWTQSPLGEFARLRRGFDLPTKGRVDGRIPIYGANGIVGTHNEMRAKGPGVVTGRSGSIGKVHFVVQDFWPLNTALYVENFFGNDPEYVALVLRAVRLERFSSYSAVPTLNRNVVHRETIAVPPITEQHRIVHQVRELWSACDELEAGLRKRTAAKGRFAAAATAALADTRLSTALAT